MQCPLCGKTFPHNCAIHTGRLGAGRTSERKSVSSRQNIRKALSKRWPAKDAQAFNTLDDAVTACEHAQKPITAIVEGLRFRVYPNGVILEENGEKL